MPGSPVWPDLKGIRAQSQTVMVLSNRACVGLKCGLRSQQTESSGDLENGNGILNPNELWPGPRLFYKLEKEGGREALLIFLRHKSPVSVSALEWGWQTMTQRPNLDTPSGVVQLTKNGLSISNMLKIIKGRVTFCDILQLYKILISVSIKFYWNKAH